MHARIINNDFRARDQIVSVVRDMGWRSMASSNTTTPWLHRQEDHTAKGSLLALSGGKSDRCVRFRNMHIGTCLKSVDTNSQSPNGCMVVTSSSGRDTTVVECA
ncbi:hypothetical protein GOBAR_DD03521 [Gossypium barbadense]|nr:hypothetical protein GOBAR_DD03521 [Gossypium barbadense]